MILNEDKVRRMIDLSGFSTGSSGASGGGGGSIPAGSFVTPDYYSQNFGLLYKQVTTDGTTGTVTTAFELAAPNMIPTEGTETDPTTGNVVVTSLIGPQVKNALVIGNIMMVYDETNNAIKVVNRDGTTAANFYATGGVSALGYSPGGGGGGGADLNLLLDNINSSNIGDVSPTASEVGKCLVYNGNNQWAWATPGGGGGTGTVTQISTGTGLSGGPITTSGTISISSAYQGYISHGETAYGWGNHADAGYATQQWVNQQGFITASALSDYLPLSGGTLTGALHMGSESGASPYIYWGDGTYAYIGEDADDHITLRGDKGVNILTGSNYELEWNGNTLATQAWVGERYLSIEFFSSLFKAYTNEGVEVTPNSGNVSTIENIKAMFGFWTEQYVSALGKNSDGSGGLNALLQGLNESAIGSVAPTTAEIGKCLVWTANGWAWGTTGSGGGGGTVTAITAGTGLSGGTITTSGTIAISTEYQTRIANGQTAYGWGNHADAGYATQSWVNQQGFLTSSALSDYLPLSGGTLTGALHMGSTAGVSPFIYWGDGTYAYIGEDSDDHITLRGDKGVNILTGSTYALSWNGNTLATQAWVEDQGFVTSSGVTSVGLSVPTGFTVSDSPVTTSGTLALGIASGYFMPTTTQRTTWNNKQDAISDLATIRSNASHGETAYGWGNHANAGYLLRTEGMRFTDYGNYIAARFVTASGASDTERAAKAQGDGYIEWWASGGYFNHELGWIRAKGNVTIGESTSDTTHYLQIGGARIYWDNANNALKLIKADGTACNLFATGGVTALQTS